MPSDAKPMTAQQSGDDVNSESIATSTTGSSFSVLKPQQHQQVLKCPECAFMCLSNNQMCRHIFMTCHTLVPCAQCNTRLVCWGFAPGVKKLFEKGRRDNILLEEVRLETAEKHFDSTQHQNFDIPSKDSFLLPGPPEAYGLQPAATKADPSLDPTAMKFRCPDCANVISTWTQMTRHLDATRHSLARCAECQLTLKCYGPAQPQRHEKMTGHRGMIGIFRQKADYSTNVHPRRRCFNPQYRCVCGISYLHPLHLADHLTTVHKITPFNEVTCQECGVEGDVVTMLAHMAQNELHVEYDINGLEEEDFVVRLPGHLVEDPAAGATAAVVAGSSSTTSGTTPTALLGNQPLSTAVNGAESTYRILYQCPDCCFIFTSWVRMEEHLLKARHGIAFCLECRRHLRPCVRDDHMMLTGHKNIAGQHMTRREYEVLVNLDDPDYKSMMDVPEANDENMSTTRLVYQCPVPSCLCAFATLSRLEEHMQFSRHGSVVCPECMMEISVLDHHEFHHHQHPLPAIPSYLARITSDDDFVVCATEAELQTHFPHEFERCGCCNKSIHKNVMEWHKSSTLCAAASTPIESLWEQPSMVSGNNGANSGSMQSHHASAANQLGSMSSPPSSLVSSAGQPQQSVPYPLGRQMMASGAIEAPQGVIGAIQSAPQHQQAFLMTFPNGQQ